MVETFIRKFTEAAHEKGIQNLEFYTESIQKVSASVYQGKPEYNQLSDVTTCYVEGEVNGKRGYIYVEDFSEEFFEEEIANLIQVAEGAGGAFQSKQLTTADCDKEYTLTEENALAEKLVQAEKETLAENPGLKKFSHYEAQEVIRRILMQNDKGDRMEDRTKYASLWLQASAEKDGAVQTAGGNTLAGSVEELDFHAVSAEAAKEACEILNAKPVPTGRYSVILKNSVITEMLGMYKSAFGADNVRKKLSKLAEKKGEQIASSIVNLIEDPNLPEGVNKRAFDDEGMPTSRKEIIKDGVLQMFLYNCEEAKKAGCKSTGNGFKENYRSVPGIGVTNLKLVGEDKTREELIQEMGDGLYITACGGMFACADPVTGKFSLISKGYLVEGGKVTRGVNQITVAGNFFDMLHDIVGISNDYLVDGGMAGVFVAPSVRIKELVVSGT